MVGAYAAICKEMNAPLDFPGAPGAYTAQVTSATAANGAALIEVYELP